MHRQTPPTSPSPVNTPLTPNHTTGTGPAPRSASPRPGLRLALRRVLGLPPAWGFLPGLAALAGCAIAPRPTVVVAVLALVTITAHHLARWIGAPR